MQYFLCAALFIPVLILALRQKRWFLYLFVALVGILPEQFSVRIHDSLPLLSATRVLTALLAVFWILERIKERNYTIPMPILVCFGLRILAAAINLRYGGSQLNQLFVLLFEQMLPILMLRDMIKTKEEFNLSVDFLIMGSMILAVIGIAQTTFEYDISSALRLQETVTSITLSERMGMTRAYATFNAIAYGCYCAFMILPICFRIANTKKKWYALALALNLAALVCSFTRSAWLAILAIGFVLVIFRLRLVVKLLPAAAVTVAILALLCVLQPKLASGLIETGKSTINVVLQVLPVETVAPTQQTQPATDVQQSQPTDTQTTSPDETDATEPTENKRPIQIPQITLSEEFGDNKMPVGSRVMQWTAVEKMFLDGEALFGYGYNALLRKKIQFHYSNWGTSWVTSSFLDVGLVALLTENGVVGAAAYILLLGYMFVYSLLHTRRRKGFDVYLLVIFMIPLYLILNVLASFLFQHVVFLLMGLFFSYQKLDREEQKKFSNV